jgi:hypothetical protein
MKRVEKLPPAFKRFRKMLGVLDFTVFEGAVGTEEEILSAIGQAIPDADVERLSSFGSRRIREPAFFGEWYDGGSGMLLMRGTYRTADGTELIDPKVKKIEGVKIVSGAGAIPDVGAGGQFAYAFSSPPYGLHARPREIQCVFAEIRAFILPPEEASTILDWSSPRLPEVSPYFAAGVDWWGVFLFSIHIPAMNRLTIVAGSTTD